MRHDLVRLISLKKLTGVNQDRKIGKDSIKPCLKDPWQILSIRSIV